MHLAKLVEEIAEETRTTAMRSIEQSKGQLEKHLGEDNGEHLATLVEVAEHALLPNFSILGDGGTLSIGTHDSGLFESPAELPSRIEEVTMQFGISDVSGEETVGEIAKTSMPFIRQIENAGLLKIRLSEGSNSLPVVDVFASSSDETWAVGVVGRARNSLKGCESRTRYLHSVTFRIVVGAFSAAVFILGLAMLKDRHQLQGVINYVGVPGKAAILALATGVALILGHKLTTYIRWLFPLLEIDPPPADARTKQRRAVVWVLAYVFLPLALDVILRVAS